MIDNLIRLTEKERKMKQELRDKCGENSILDLALDIHSATNGSLSCDPKLTESNVYILTLALKSWQDPSSQFGLAVKKVCEEALLEYWKNK